MIAEGLDAALEIDAPAVDDETLLVQRVGDVARRHRAVERAGLADPLGDLDAQALHGLGDAGGGIALLGVLGVDLGPLLLEVFDVGVRRLERETLGNEEIPAVTRLDVHHLAALAEVALIAEQYDSHVPPS